MEELPRWWRLNRENLFISHLSTKFVKVYLVIFLVALMHFAIIIFLHSNKSKLKLVRNFDDGNSGMVYGDFND